METVISSVVCSSMDLGLLDTILVPAASCLWTSRRRQYAVPRLSLPGTVLTVSGAAMSQSSSELDRARPQFPATWRLYSPSLAKN